MASNAIQIPDIEQRLSKFFGIRGEGRIAPVIAPEVVPVVIVADLDKAPPQGTTQSARFLYAHGAPITHPATGAYIEFHNPVASAQTLRFLRWFVRATTVHALHISRMVGNGPHDPIYSGESSWEDFTSSAEAGGDQSGVIHISTGGALPAVIDLVTIDVGPGIPLEIVGTNFLLGPGQSILINTATVGGILEASCRVEVKPL